ncbi:2Fe-2S iron-sulfur cluster binding domain-containing protein [Lujinxingia vulgaris]|uniref:2Fe-2S iron-sulfur cluster binding domain-containing protein n=2 Tax=Lujinxingia vulgaris TaxID=2600176 RepID=A0A5C6X9B3_9DELT|nr:2Fe-2S iron-sulfur cluster binding domain-containing protein [Lujinxingia vulgaris]
MFQRAIEASMTTHVEFWLNDRRVITDVPDGMLVLDYLRKDRLLTGTKEGCKEGDCGACSILIGEVVDGVMRYQPVTSCLTPVGEMHGKHVVSIEGLNLPNKLNPVQQAMVDRVGSQCGFCTPGFIVSMCWYMMAARETPTLEGFQRAFSGNLCRCTGYAAINRASLDLVEQFGPGGQWASIWQADDRLGALMEAGLLPGYFAEMPKRLEAIGEMEEVPRDDADVIDFFVAGGTDLYVQKGELLPRAQVKILNRHPEMKGIRKEGDTLHIGALTTFEEFGASEDVLAFIPEIQDYLHLIASLPLRNRATIAGNIINASPIGDMTAIMLALDTTLVFARGETTREVELKRFYKGYKTFDKHPAEVMTEMVLKVPAAGTGVYFEKVSKRRCLDIATVNSAAKLRISDEGVVEEASLTLGGVAATPLWLEKTGEFLNGEVLSETLWREALRIAHTEMSPISDVRGSAEYKRLLATQLLTAHVVKAAPERVSLDAMLAI